MNLSFMLKERAAKGKPIRIGQVGAGKFGTMFLSQLRWTKGMHLTAIADLLPARAHGAADGRAVAEGAARRQVDRRGDQDRQDAHHRQRHVDDREPRHRSDHRGDRRSGDRHQHRLRRDRRRQARRHGQRRGRCARRPAARQARAREGRRLFARLGRSAGARLPSMSTGRASCGFEVVVRRQGHALPADLPPVDARDGVGHPRPVSGHPRQAATSTRRCSTRSSTAPSPASR